MHGPTRVIIPLSIPSIIQDPLRLHINRFVQSLKYLKNKIKKLLILFDVKLGLP